MRRIIQGLGASLVVCLLVSGCGPSLPEFRAKEATAREAREARVREAREARAREEAALAKCLTFERCKFVCPDGAKEIKEDLRRYCQKDGQKHGPEYRWYKGGVRMYVNGWLRYFEKDFEATYKDGKKHGLVTKWYGSGKKDFEATYKDGKKHGLVTKWFMNGKLWRKFTYKDGKKHGPSTEWYENGKKDSEHTYKDGKLHGLVTSWHENGQKSSEVTYKDGEPDGPETRWHENGQKKEESNVKNGNTQGDSELASSQWAQSSVNSELLDCINYAMADCCNHQREFFGRDCDLVVCPMPRNKHPKCYELLDKRNALVRDCRARFDRGYCMKIITIEPGVGIKSD